MTLEDLLRGYPEPVGRLTRALCAFLRDLVPEAEERVYPGWRGIGYRQPGVGYVFGVFPRQDEVRLLFERGGALSDPDRELSGTGTQTRYLALSPRDELPHDTIARFVGRALSGSP